MALRTFVFMRTTTRQTHLRQAHGYPNPVELIGEELQHALLFLQAFLTKGNML